LRRDLLNSFSDLASVLHSEEGAIERAAAIPLLVSLSIRYLKAIVGLAFHYGPFLFEC
jgi:hypothetical protein